MNPLIIEDLAKSYSTKKGPLVAVDGISFEIKSGECFGLLGPNGAGKSTSINCITGFYPVTRGRVLLMGIDVHSDPKRARAILGICPQDETLDTDFSVLDQMIRHATYFRLSETEGKIRAEHWLKRFGIFDKRSEAIESLSGGMRRRLQVARALVSDPKILILDEPTTGLDPEARRLLWEIIGDYRRNGGAVLLSTHYMEEAERLCDRIAILYSGKILDVGSSSELVSRHISEKTIEEEVRPGVTWKRPPNLEDVFLGITGKKLEA